MKDKIGYGVKWTIRKFKNDVDYSADKPYETITVDRNILLNEGITRLLNLLSGGGGTPYNNANARLGVGDSNTAANATQTALLGASQLFKGMDGGYPTISAQTITFRSTFTGGEGNFSWQEFSVDNGAGANENLNRLVSNQGTKTSGQTWELTLDITFS